MKFIVKKSSIIVGLLLLASGAAQAAVQISVYSGGNNALDSDVTYSNGNSPVTNNVSWDGEPFNDPIYWGVRAVYWLDNPQYSAWGFGLDYTHDKVVADPKPPGFTWLEFTDGLNLFTADVFYHYLNQTRFTPYAGLGLGMSVPHVEENTVEPLVPSHTMEYQVAGIALAALAGVDIHIWRGFSIFGEYKLNFSQNNTVLNEGQTMDTNLWVNNFIFGISYLFK